MFILQQRYSNKNQTSNVVASNNLMTVSGKILDIQLLLSMSDGICQSCWRLKTSDRSKNDAMILFSVFGFILQYIILPVRAWKQQHKTDDDDSGSFEHIEAMFFMGLLWFLYYEHGKGMRAACDSCLASYQHRLASQWLIFCHAASEKCCAMRVKVVSRLDTTAYSYFQISQFDKHLLDYLQLNHPCLM